MAEHRPRRFVSPFRSLQEGRRVAGQLPAAVGALTFLLLAGCSKADPSPGQVAAQVNADQISMTQVASAVSRLPDVAPERLQKARLDTLGLLVDQQLAAQMAMKQGLERDPEVVSRLDAARREILARSYLSRVVAQLPPPSDAEVERYYDAHPLLYAQRRYYVLREIALPARAVPLEQLRAMAARVSVEQVAAWLRVQGVAYSVSAAQRPAEDIPPEVLAAVSRLHRGATTVVVTDDGAFVVHLLDTRQAPLTLGVAAPRIRHQLADAGARAAVMRDIAQIKGRSRIEYRNEFAAAGPPAADPAEGALAAGARSRTLLVDDAPPAH
ncbi:MAG TPA: EpsD family peptidyl-prolyl cis-trans isomerase [Burkholderiales bacterium]